MQIFGEMSTITLNPAVIFWQNSSEAFSTMWHFKVLLISVHYNVDSSEDVFDIGGMER
jgi:hypothetical protein